MVLDKIDIDGCCGKRDGRAQEELTAVIELNECAVEERFDVRVVCDVAWEDGAGEDV